MHQQTSLPETSRRWTPADKGRLHHFRFIELFPWLAVAAALGRTTQVVLRHVAEGASFEDRDAIMNEYIIDCRGKG